MQIIEKVKSICNYVENNTISSNQINVSWIETISSSKEEYIREQKRKNRELSIDVVLDNITESDWRESKSQSDWEMNIDEEYSNIVTPKMAANINGKKYTNKSDIYDHLISFLEAKTGNKKKKFSGNSNMNLDVQLVNDINLTEQENYNANLRRIITKITMHSNIIAMDGRIGPGNSIIIGKNNWEYFKNIELNFNGIYGMKFIYEDSIADDKIIICRSNITVDKPGIILVNDTNNNQYFFKETNFWERQYSWFWIK